MTHLQSSPPKAARRTGSFLLLALMLTALQFSLVAPGALAAPKPKPPKTSSISLVPTITGISFVNGQVVASGFVTATIKGTTTRKEFRDVLVDLRVVSVTPPSGCAILDLSLGPITVDLLGLVVETSPICLKITAVDDGLLGSLLCDVAGLLNGGLSLSQILAGQSLLDPLGGVILPGLTTNQIGQLTSGLIGLLNGALERLIGAILDQILPGGACGILHLELGPVDLTLLGLNVHLDDCDGGPVVVDITAQPGPGALLGNLLCELLDGGLLGVGQTLEGILNRILALLNQ